MIKTFICVLRPQVCSDAQKNAVKMCQICVYFNGGLI